MKHAIHKESMVIALDSNNQKVCKKICDLQKGFKLIGFDLNNNQECINTILDIRPINIPEERQVRFWFRKEMDDTFLIVDEDQELDYFDYAINNWTYKLAKDLQSGDIIKAYDNNEIRVQHVDTNCNMEENSFVALVIDNSHNFYAKKHETTKKELEDQQKAHINENPENAASSQNVVVEPIVYDMFYDNQVLLRALKQ